MGKPNRIIAILAFVVFCTLVGLTLYRWVRFGIIDGGSIFFSFLALSYFFNWLNWGNHEGGGEKDELDRHIESQSAKIGYFVLMILSGLILFISDGVSNLLDIKNYPLLIVVGLTFVTLPITEFVYSRKYK
ncbi:hypothetical protein FQ087_22050 [Sporosarcina sp. ANT_H38]|uniref:hypothetical protein n=1 Tax=unclassified Sporosarcina TaxID=2647733 RepID=UPI0011F12DE0|nr:MULTISPECIES: hypothetical protein [unclassified Sporosarcina]KAA0940221.1 hypothetical protein FQ087_22050 [Sporosarcina sp. ANT_H38]QJS06549.1 hypothetical protein [Sporosarcina sp.]